MSIREASAQLYGRGPALSVSLLFLLSGAAIPAMAVPISITGQFVAKGGHGVARVKVELVPLAASSDSAPPLATAASDASGRFRLEAPEPGMWKVLAHAEGYVPLETELAPLVEPADLVDPLEQEIELGRQREARHVRVEPREKWIRFRRFEQRIGVEIIGKRAGEARLAGTDRPLDDDIAALLQIHGRRRGL